MRRKTTTPRVRPEWEPLEVRTVPTAIIALIDTGVDLNNSTLSPYIDYAYGYDAYNKQTVAQYGTSVVAEIQNHGTPVATFMVNAITTTKAQPGASGADVKIMPIRAAYNSGGNTYFDNNAVIRGIYWAADHGADVINLSYRSSGPEPRLNDPGQPNHLKYISEAIRYAESMGAVVVTASGNNSHNVDLAANVAFPVYGDDPIQAHASNPLPTNLLVAAGIDGSGNLTSLSNWGPVHVDFGAPASAEGFTSQSAGYTSGVAAVIADLLPSTHTAKAVVDILKQTVIPKTQTVATNWSVTNGNINPAGAVASIVGQPMTAILDDDSAGTGPSFTKVGTWSYYSGLNAQQNHLGDSSETWAIGASATPTATATWTFTNLTPGTYRVRGAWYAVNNRAADAPFTIKDGSTALNTVRMNQRNDSPVAPDYYDSNSLPWWTLGGAGTTFTITGTQLSVTLGNNATSGMVIADGMRIERIGSMLLAADESSSGEVAAALTLSQATAFFEAGTDHPTPIASPQPFWKINGGYRRAPQAQPQLFDVRVARLARAYQALAEGKRRAAWLNN